MHVLRIRQMKVVVVGGGIFGSLTAIELALRGASVVLLEASRELLSQASMVNQARLHTGMHYPRDFQTAQDALEDYWLFRKRFSHSVIELEQFYGVHSASSLSFENFRLHAMKLGLNFREESPERFFRSGRLQGLIRVPESTFDVKSLRATLLNEVERSKRIQLRLGTNADEIVVSDRVLITTSVGLIDADAAVVATYANLGHFASQVGINLPPITSQVAQVLLGTFNGLEQKGLTVMDGPFWSTMPFGSTGFHSLTHVTKTPVRQSENGPLACQTQRQSCGTPFTFSCVDCRLLPPIDLTDFVRETNADLKDEFEFRYTKRLATVKSILGDPESKARAARPSSVFWESTGRVALVHSGKVGSSIRVSRQIAEKLLP